MGATDFFANAQVTAKLTTLFRTNYICKPIAGLITKHVNFFQDGSYCYCTLVCAEQYNSAIE